MHPLFKELYLTTDDADLLADEEQRRARRARRNRSRLVLTVRSGRRSSKPRVSTG